MEELYDKEKKLLEEDRPIPLEKTVEGNTQGPALLFSEFEVALDELKNRNAEGLDGIPGELLKGIGSKGKQALYEICSQIYETARRLANRLHGICNYSFRKEMWSTRLRRI